MSRTTVKAIWPGVKVKDLEELGNAWGSAPLVWEALSMKYLGWDSAKWLLTAGTPEGNKLEELGRRADIPASHSAVMRMTFDLAYVRREHFARAAEDIRQFLIEFAISGYRAYGGKVNHWLRIAAIFESHPACPAIGFHMTSVSEDTWENVDWSDTSDVYG